MLARPEATISAGRLIAYHALDGAVVVIVENPAQTETATIDAAITKGPRRLHSCDKPYFLLAEDPDTLRLRVRLAPEECAVIVMR